MMRFRVFVSFVFSCVVGVTMIVRAADGLDPAQLLKPLGESWPTYSGDYTGRRYSALTQIDQSNVRHLSLAWLSKLAGGPGAANPAPGAPGTTVRRGGSGDVVGAGAGTLKGAILEGGDILYVTGPHHVWALD